MTEWTPVAIAALLGALGVGGIITKLAERAIEKFTGRGPRRRDEVHRAYAYGDREAWRARRAEEYSGRLKRMLIDAPCVDTSTIPEEPPSPPKEPS